MSERLERARAVLAGLGVDAALIVNPPNRRYLTGFTAADHGADEPAAWLVLDADHARLLGSPTNTPWARAEVTAGVEVIDVINPTRSFVVGVLELVEAHGWTSIGIEERILPTNAYLGLVAHEGLDVVPIGTAFDDLRAVKDDDEIASIAEAIRITDVAFTAAQRQLRAGMSEIAFADVVRAELRNAGSDGEGFDTIVASGPNAAKPHHVPGDRIIQEGEPVIVDMGGKYQGYVGDLTRTIWVGEPSARLSETYALVLQAFDATIAGLRAGRTGREADSLARDVFHAAGEGEAFVHGLGHGIGLLVHESPSASQRSSAILRAGELLTVEPGLYYPDWGGVRIEDSVVITETGVRNLTTSPKFAADTVFTTSGDVL